MSTATTSALLATLVFLGNMERSNTEVVKAISDGYTGGEVTGSTTVSYGRFAVRINNSDAGGCVGVERGMGLHVNGHDISLWMEESSSTFKASVVDTVAKTTWTQYGWVATDIHDLNGVELRIDWTASSVRFYVNSRQLSTSLPIATSSTSILLQYNAPGTTGSFTSPHTPYIFIAPSAVTRPTGACLPYTLNVLTATYTESSNPTVPITMTWIPVTGNGVRSSSQSSSAVLLSSAVSTDTPGHILTMKTGFVQYVPLDNSKDKNPDLTMELKSADWEIKRDPVASIDATHETGLGGYLKLTIQHVGENPNSISVEHVMFSEPGEVLCGVGRVKSETERNISIRAISNDDGTVLQTSVDTLIPPNAWRTTNTCVTFPTSENLTFSVLLGSYNSLTVFDYYAVHVDFIYGFRALLDDTLPPIWVGTQLLSSWLAVPLYPWVIPTTATSTSWIGVVNRNLDRIELTSTSTGDGRLSYRAVVLKRDTPYKVSVTAFITSTSTVAKDKNLFISLNAIDGTGDIYGGVNQLTLTADPTTREYTFTVPTQFDEVAANLDLTLLSSFSQIDTGDVVTVTSVTLEEWPASTPQRVSPGLIVDPALADRDAGGAYAPVALNPTPVSIGGAPEPPSGFTNPPAPTLKTPLRDLYDEYYRKLVMKLTIFAGMSIPDTFNVTMYREDVGAMLQTVLNTRGVSSNNIKVLKVCVKTEKIKSNPETDLTTKPPPRDDHRECRGVVTGEVKWFNHITVENQALEVHFMAVNLAPSLDETQVTRDLTVFMDQAIVNTSYIGRTFVGPTALVESYNTETVSITPSPQPAAPPAGKRSDLSDGIWVIILFSSLFCCIALGGLAANVVLKSRSDFMADYGSSSVYSSDASELREKGAVESGEYEDEYAEEQAEGAAGGVRAVI